MAELQLPPRWTKLRQHTTQRKLWTDSHRFKIVCAGRGSGKTEIAKRYLVRWLPVKKPWPDPRYAFLAPTRPQAKRIAWQDLLALTPKEWIADVSLTELKITTVFGSELHVIGMEKPQRFEGLQWDGCVNDETSDHKNNVFGLSIRPALTHREGFCWQIGVPKRAGSNARNFKKQFEQGKIGGGDFVSYHWPSSDILTAEEIRLMKQSLSPKDYDEQANASWVTASGRCFHSFTADNIRPVSYCRNLPIYVGCDFNVDPMAWTLSHKLNDSLQTFDELHIRNTNTRESLNALWSRYSSHGADWVFIGDAASRARKTSASTTDYLQIRNDTRFNARTLIPKSNPPILVRLAECNALFQNADGEIKYFVDPSCKNLIDDLENRALSADGYPDDSDPDSGHATDALGYAIHKLFPMRLDNKTTATAEVSLL